MQWHLPTIAESVPILFQMSFILFSYGLVDSVVNINTSIGYATSFLITSSVLCFTVLSYLTAISPHSPYQTLLSRLFWALFQTCSLSHNHRDSDGALTSVSPDMTIGQMQFAMVETDARKERDEEAIQWLIRKMTEDAEMESLVMAIPGSFNCKWGLEVWKNVSKPLANDPHTGPMPLVPRSDPQNVRPYPTTAHIEGEHVMHELNTRVSHLMETCKKPDLFAGQELWRQRTRGCIETVASLVCFTGTDLGQFGDIVELLGDIGVDLKVRESSSKGKDLMFVMRWTCLSLVAIQPILASDQNLRSHARLAVSSLTKDQYPTGARPTPTRIIGTFKEALECTEELSDALLLVKDIEEEDAKKILHDHKSLISKLAGLGDQYDHSADTWIQAVQHDLVKTTHRIICQLPGIELADPDANSAYLGQLKTLCHDPHIFPSITSSHFFKGISQVAHTSQNLLEGQWNEVTFKEGIKGLKEMLSSLRGDLFHREVWHLQDLCEDRGLGLLHREVWRLQDLCEGHGLGFIVELFFLAFKQLLSKSSSKELYSAFLMGTFQAITSDSSKYQSPLGTQQFLLDFVVSDNDIIFGSIGTYPDPIIDEFLKLLATVLKGQSGPHIEHIVQLLTRKLEENSILMRRAFYKNALEVIKKATESDSEPLP